MALAAVFALPAEIVLRCGLRCSEVAGMKGSDIDLANQKLHIQGKGGKFRFVELSADLAVKLNTSKEYLFTPNQSWKSAFYQALRQAAREMGIKISGLCIAWAPTMPRRSIASCASRASRTWQRIRLSHRLSATTASM